MRTTVTFNDILRNDGVASILVHLLDLEDKRNLRLVGHAGKDAVDKTVTAVSLAQDTCKPEYNYARILVNSNWKAVKKIHYHPYKEEGSRLNMSGLSLIAEGGFSNLDSLNVYMNEHEDALCAAKVVSAGWKLKELSISGPCLTAAFLGQVMREANWHLESLDVVVNDIQAAIISMSDWPLKNLVLSEGIQTLSSEGVAFLMQGQWVRSIQKLDLSEITIDVEKARAIAEASHRAECLIELDMSSCDIKNEGALILGEGSYPRLKELSINYNSLAGSGLAAILRKCPALEDINLELVLATALDDSNDAKTIAIHLQKCKTLDFTSFEMTKHGAQWLFAHMDWPFLESLDVGCNASTVTGEQLKVDYGDEVIAGLVQCEWPCLTNLSLTECQITSEGNEMFSAKKFPALETLTVDVDNTGLKLQPDKLPRLKRLTLCYNISDAVSHIIMRSWAKLTELDLYTWDAATPLIWYLETVEKVTPECMPELKTLNFSHRSEGDRPVIRWAVRTLGRQYKLDFW